jgi:hypothetical protein
MLDLVASLSLPLARAAIMIDAGGTREAGTLVPLSALMSGASGRSGQPNKSLSP